MKKSIREIEDFLRNSRLPDQNTVRYRHQVWRKLVGAQRQRRRGKSLFKMPYWVWPLASIVLVVLFWLLFFWLGR